MDSIDDEGRLFGIINVVDALVILFVLAVAVAGIALVFGPDTTDESDGTTYTTLDLGTLPEHVAEDIESGDAYSPDGSAGSITITDVYLAPEGEDVRAYVRTRVNGTVRDGTFDYDGTPLRFDRSLSVFTSRYSVNGTVREFADDSRLTRETREVLIRDEVDSDIVERLAVGDTYSVDGHDIATVESVTAYGTGDPDRKRVFVGLSLETIRLGDDYRFGDARIREGIPIPFHTNVYELDGTITRVGGLEERGTETTRTASLRMTDVPPERADLIRAGMTERAAGETVAELVAVEREPSKIATTSQDGEIFLREHPLNRDLHITADLTVRQTTDAIRFKGERIQSGSNLTLSLGDTTVQATIVST